jgi:hypothetical protein
MSDAVVKNLQELKKSSKAAKDAGGERQSRYINTAGGQTSLNARVPFTQKRVKIGVNLPYTPSHARFAQKQRAANISSKSQTDNDKVVAALKENKSKEESK